MMKKSGVVLMITLMLIASIMSIVALLLTQNRQLINSADSGFNQNVTLQIINDLEKELPTLLSSINGPEELDLAMRLPLQIESKKGDFSLRATFLSPYSRLNINRLLNADAAPNLPYIEVWMKIFEHYPIADSDLFLKLVLDTIDIDLVERSEGTEIGWIRSDFSHGSISNKKQFYQIVERYVAMTRDRTVLVIPWDKYIGFEGEKVDLNAVNAETLSLLLPNAASETISQLTHYRTKAFVSKDEAISKEPLLSGIFDNFLFIYQPAQTYKVDCDVKFTQNHHDEHVRFNYNLSDKKIKNIEFL